MYRQPAIETFTLNTFLIEVHHIKSNCSVLENNDETKKLYLILIHILCNQNTEIYFVKHKIKNKFKINFNNKRLFTNRWQNFPAGIKNIFLKLIQTAYSCKFFYILSQNCFG